jgi:hypothetical protein
MSVTCVEIGNLLSSEWLNRWRHAAARRVGMRLVLWHKEARMGTQGTMHTTVAVFRTPPLAAPPRLFAFRVEEAVLDRWYVALAAFVATLTLPPAVQFVSDGAGWIAAGGDPRRYLDVEAGARLGATTGGWLGYVWATAILLAPWLFNRWRRAFGPLVSRLLASGRITARAGGDAEETYAPLLARYQRALLGPRRYLFVAVGIAVYLAPAVRVVLTVDPLYYTRRLGTVGTLFDLRGALLALVWAPLLLYFLGIGAWIMYATSAHLRRLLEAFDVVVQPSHPDHCGGLSPLGDVFIRAGLEVAFIIALFAMGLSPLNLFIGTAFKLAGGLGFVLFALPLVVAIVVTPAQILHRRMVAAKEWYEDTVATRLNALEMRALALLDAGELEPAKAVQAELEIVHTLYPAERGYPTWPFTAGTALSFVSVQALSVLGPVAGALWQAVVAAR